MPESITPTFLVDMNAAPILILVRGRANYMNCAPFGEILEQIISSPAAEVRIDFGDCAGMDSTFLGLLAGAAMKFQSRTPPGKISLRQLSARNRELIRNLGIERFLEIAKPTDPAHPPLPVPKEIGDDKPVDREAMLRAHENLIAANPENLPKFQDVVEYLSKKKAE